MAVVYCWNMSVNQCYLFLVLTAMFIDMDTIGHFADTAKYKYAQRE